MRVRYVRYVGLKRALRVVGVVAACLGTAGFLYAALRSLDWGDLAPYLEWRSAALLVIAATLYAATIPISALAWQQLLASMGEKRPYRRLNAMMLATQIGKYLPGNVGHVVGRVALAVRDGLRPATVATSLAYEVVLLLLSGVAVGLVAAVLSPQGTALLPGSIGGRVAFAGLVGLGGLAGVYLAGRFLPRLATAVGLGAFAGHTRLPSRSALGVACLLYVGAYLAIGGSAAVLADGLRTAAHPGYALLTGAFAIAWIAGFVTPGAPAGIGVREALLMLMLGPSMGTADASLLVLALRLATILGDILCFAAGLPILLGSKQAPGPAKHGIER